MAEAATPSGGHERESGGHERDPPWADAENSEDRDDAAGRARSRPCAAPNLLPSMFVGRRMRLAACPCAWVPGLGRVILGSQHGTLSLARVATKARQDRKEEAGDHWS
jgi:hypothetical protein